MGSFSRISPMFQVCGLKTLSGRSTLVDVCLFFTGLVHAFEPDSEASLSSLHAACTCCALSSEQGPQCSLLLYRLHDGVALCVMICRVKLLLDFLAPHQAEHYRSEVPTRGSHRPESYSLTLRYLFCFKRNLCSKSPII